MSSIDKVMKLKKYSLAFLLTIFCLHAKSASLSEQQCAIDLCGKPENYLSTKARGPFGTLPPSMFKNLLKIKQAH